MITAARIVLASIAIGATGSALAALTADYRFQNTLTSSVGAAPALANVGAGVNAFATETVDSVSRTVLTFPQDNGVALTPTTSVTANDTYSIVVLARLATITGYRRYIDVKNATSDTGLYNLGGQLNFFNFATGLGAPITANSYRQIVLTRDGITGTLIGYVDGVQQINFIDGSGAGTISAANALRFFIDDSVVSGEDSAGAVARIRIYNSVLTPGEVAALDRAAGPVAAAAVVPTLSPIALMALMLLLGAAALAAFRTRRSPR
jgi:hypothetical protein